MNRKKGFTLLEMSIVIAVIALIIGGIMTAKSLVRSARLQSITGDIGKYTQSFVDFRDKYQALPGDFAAATAVWGTDPGGCPNTPANTVTKKETCNGDGNGRIDGTNEKFRAWQQLADGNFIGASFTGVAGASGDSIPGVNAPNTLLPGVTWLAYYDGHASGNTDLFDGEYGNALHVYAISSPYGFLTPREAFAIDQKLDDGVPGTGTLRGYKNTAVVFSTSCTTGTTAAAGYNTSYSDYACALVLITGF